MNGYYLQKVEPGLTTEVDPGLTISMDQQNLAQGFNPVTFVEAAENATPGWTEQYGGLEGIALLCAQIQRQLGDLSEAVAAIRVAAVQGLLETQSGVEVSKSLGVSKAAISKINRNKAWENPTW